MPDACNHAALTSIVPDVNSLRFQIVYEDEHMACVVKPQGMPTAQVYHPPYAHLMLLLCVCTLHVIAIQTALYDIMCL